MLQYRFSFTLLQGDIGESQVYRSIAVTEEDDDDEEEVPRVIPPPLTPHPPTLTHTHMHKEITT